MTIYHCYKNIGEIWFDLAALWYAYNYSIISQHQMGHISNTPLRAIEERNWFGLSDKPVKWKGDK